MASLGVILFAAAAAGQVSQEWVRRYAQPGVNGLDEVRDTAVKTVSGTTYVYVTGFVKEANGSTRIATLRYNAVNPAPLPEASAFFPPDPAYGGTHRGNAIWVADDGTVYVAGESQIDPNMTVGSDFNYVVLKYDHTLDALVPSESWASESGLGDGVRRFDGQGCWDTIECRDDRAVDIEVDHLGDVYVTGTSNGIVTGDDIVTLRYDAAGNFSALWPASAYGPQGVRRYNFSPSVNGPDTAVGLRVVRPSIAPQHPGFAYVAGTSYGGPSTGNDFVVIGYGINGLPGPGALGWVTRYDGPAHGHDAATGIDWSTYRVVVAGYTPHWDPPGTSGASVGPLSALDNMDYATIKLEDTQGAPDTGWPDVGYGVGVRLWNGPGPVTASNDFATAVRFGGTHTMVFVAGAAGSPSGNHDFGILAYDIQGMMLPGWPVVFGEFAGREDWPTAIRVDQGTKWCYITGRSQNASNNFDFFTFRLDISSPAPCVGDQWCVRSAGFGGFDGANAIVLPEGNVYVGGRSWSPTQGEDMLTIKYSQSP